MTNYVRMIAIGGTVGVLVAGVLATPAFIGAMAGEPADNFVGTVADLFPPPFDATVFTKYAIHFDETVSTSVKSRVTVKKLGYGYATNVLIVTTPSGTYSSDGLLSPNVRYPGIEVGAKRQSRGSFWFQGDAPPEGSGGWVSFTTGSITYYTHVGEPAART